MKKKYFQLLLIIIVVTLVSCTAEKQDNNIAPKKYFRADNDYPYCYDYDLKYCITPPENCMKTVDITAPKKNSYNDFIEAVSNGPSAISTYFDEGSWNELFPDIDATDLTNLRSGSYNIIELIDGDIVHYLAGPTSTLSKSNVDFVLVVDTSLL